MCVVVVLMIGDVNESIDVVMVYDVLGVWENVMKDEI